MKDTNNHALFRLCDFATKKFSVFVLALQKLCLELILVKLSISFLKLLSDLKINILPYIGSCLTRQSFITLQIFLMVSLKFSF